ncbi:reverse transcriptase domain-containing protein [Tanacetum coccineum]
MANHSQKWHDETSSRNVSSNSNTDGLAAIVSKLDNLERDMKKLKENVHTIQVGCKICEGPHLDKECPLNEEFKQLEEVKYREFGRSAPFNGSNGAKFRVGPPGYYTRTDNRPPYREKRPSLEELMNKHQEESSQRSAEMKEWTTYVAHSSSTEQCKVVNNDHETQHRKLNNKEGWTTKDIQCQLPHKELNPGNFTLPYTIGNFNFYGLADLGANVNVMPRNTFEQLRLANLRDTNMLVEMTDMTKKAPIGIIENILVRINKFLFPLDFVIIDKTPNETIILGRPFLATIHAEIDVFDKKISLGVDNARVSYDMEKKYYNFTTPTEKIFMIKSNLENRPQSPVCSDNQSRNLPNRSPNDSQGSKNKKINLDQHIPRAHFCKPIKQTIDKKTIMWPTCDPNKSMCDGGDEIYEVSRVGNLRFWYCNYDNKRKNITGMGLSFPDYLLAKYRKYQNNSLV